MKKLQLSISIALGILMFLVSATTALASDCNHDLVFREGTVSCTQDGYEDYYECISCGKLFQDKACTEEITEPQKATAWGHRFGNWAAEDEGHYRQCPVCDYLTNVEKHKFKTVTDKQPTATETGLKHEECTVCGYTQNMNTVIDKVQNKAAIQSNSTAVSPKTGDNSRIFECVALLLITCCAAADTILLNRNKIFNK